MNRATLTFCYVSIAALAATSLAVAWLCRSPRYEFVEYTRWFGESLRKNYILRADAVTGAVEVAYPIAEPSATATAQP